MADIEGESSAAPDTVADEASAGHDATVVSGLVDAGGRAPIGAAVETVGAASVPEESVDVVDPPPASPVERTVVETAANETSAKPARTEDSPDETPVITPPAVAEAVEPPRQPAERMDPPAADTSEDIREAGTPAAVASVPVTPVEVREAEVAPPPSAAVTDVEGRVDFLMKFTAPTVGGTSQVFDNGNFVGIGTTDPKQRLEVNGNIQINEQNSSVAGLLITQSGGETGYIMHNRASKLTIGAGSIDRITIDRDGNVGFGVNRPANPIELPSGAHVTRGGVWTNSSSRARKENIQGLTTDEAIATLDGLEPVHFNYRDDRDEHYVGFIAEDVPALVATSDREGLSAMDIVAVLTKVVQQQQKQIEALEARLDQR